MGPVITLTTDFDTRDAYVASMKGALLSVNPAANLVDVAHRVPPQDVFHGAYVLSSMWHFFPPGTVHVAVVDPGVGTSRRPLAVLVHGHYFVGPDNGVLSLALGPTAAGVERDPSPFEAVEAPVPESAVAVELANASFRLPSVSGTFHGRDVFAPAAAHLSAGVPFERFGPRVESIKRFVLPNPSLGEDGAIRGMVVHVDGYGNLVSNIRPEHIPAGDVIVTAGAESVSGISSSYADAAGRLAVWGSMGTLEIAVTDGSAASGLGLARGASVVVRAR